jgi:cobalt/nickel transport system ATP-binding protein
MTSLALDVRNATYRYPDGTCAIEDVTFSVGPNEAVALVGPSGAGKTTLMLCIVGFLELERGEIRVKDLRVGKKTLRQIREEVGMIFQNADDQLFMPTVYEDVAFGALNKGMKGTDLDRTVQRALADRGLSGMEEKFPGHLSGGQKRLASLAGVLVMEPGILLLDEPSSNLDPKSRRQLIRQLDDLQNARVLASHDLEMVLDFCTRVLVLDHGRLVAEGDPATILADEEMMEACNLEVPHSLLPHRFDHHDTPRSRRDP